MYLFNNKISQTPKIILQEYTDKEQANTKATDPPVRSINAYLQQPLERIQKYKATLKVTDLTANMCVFNFVFFRFAIKYAVHDFKHKLLAVGFVSPSLQFCRNV